MLKIFVGITNAVALVFLSAIVIDEGLPSSGSDKALIGCLLLACISSLVLLMRGRMDDDETLFGLWISVRKKKLREELNK